MEYATSNESLESCPGQIFHVQCENEAFRLSIYSYILVLKSQIGRSENYHQKYITFLAGFYDVSFIDEHQRSLAQIQYLENDGVRVAHKGPESIGATVTKIFQHQNQE